MKKIIITLIISSAFILSTEAQNKFGYINSNELLSMMPETKEKQEEYQIHGKNLESNLIAMQVEYEKMIMQLYSMNKDYEVKRLMALDKGESIKQQIMQMERAIQTYQAEKVGPQGELMKKSAQMEYEILGKVREAVRKVAIDKGFDYIMDSSMGLLYAKPNYDVTDDVLHELRNLKAEK